MTDHVLVIGGSVAGLALAAALDPRRVRVTLVEERPDRAGGGTLLALWRGALTALDEVGVGEQVRAAGFPEEVVALRDARGRVLTRQRVHLQFTPRAALIAALEAAVPDTVERQIRQVSDPRSLAAELGADLVVGADGVRSVCRRAAFPGADPVVTDWVALRGHLPRPHEVTSEWWGPGGLFGVTPGPEGTAWFAAVRSDDRRPVVDRDEVLALAAARFRDWDPYPGEVLTAAGGSADAQRILVAPPLRRIVGERLVLIGDAAHAMTPNLGRGANEAIRDAVVLARMIHRDGTKGGPPAFERRRHLVGQGLRVTASLAMRTATSRRAAPVRDRVLRGLPSRESPPTRG
ncbi:FAD-dependent monooxygenase [Janibacter sp. GS2]|uniref:FAD-dependent monooxygenase n=1 Tax=Janibacter sp. GS2 TaxID=3442646 RepID=UPI003EB9F785